MEADDDWIDLTQDEPAKPKAKRSRPLPEDVDVSDIVSTTPTPKKPAKAAPRPEIGKSASTIGGARCASSANMLIIDDDDDDTAQEGPFLGQGAGRAGTLSVADAAEGDRSGSNGASTDLYSGVGDNFEFDCHRDWEEEEMQAGTAGAGAGTETGGAGAGTETGGGVGGASSAPAYRAGGRSSQSLTSVSASKRRRSMTAEERLEAAAAKSASKMDAALARTFAREEVKATKAASLAVQKEAVRLTKMESQAARGAFKELEIAVVMSADLHAGEIGVAIRTACANADGGAGASVSSGVKVLSPLQVDAAGAGSGSGSGSFNPLTTTRLPSCVQWRRGVLRPSVGAIPQFDFARAATVEPFAAVVMTGAEWLSWIDAARAVGPPDRLVSSAVAAMRRMQGKAPQGARLSVFVVGLKDAVKRASDRYERRAGGAAGGPVQAKPLTMDHLNSLHTHLYVDTEVDVKADFPKVENVGEMITRLTRAIAAAPYKTAPTALACVAREKVNIGPEGKDASGGRSLKGTWQAMLMMMPGMSKDKAAGIVRAFPTFPSLMTAFRDISIPESTRKALVAEAIKRHTGKNVNHGKLSEDVFHFFTSTDPARLVGHGSH